jgi:hypothetical protein
MQKRLIHHLLLLLALIFGPAAAASPAAAPKAADLAAIKSSHLIHLKSIEQVRLAGIGRNWQELDARHSRLKKRLYRLPIAGFTMLGSPPCAARPELRPVEA